MRQKYQPHLVALSKLADQLSEDFIRSGKEDRHVQTLYFDTCILITQIKERIKKVEEDE